MKTRNKYISRKKKKNIFVSKAALFFLIIILAGVINITYEKFKEWYLAKKILIMQEKEIKEAKGRETSLRDSLDYLRSEGYLIRVIKKKLNLVSPGEKVIFVMPEEKKEDDSVQEQETENINFFEKFLRKLKEVFQYD